MSDLLASAGPPAPAEPVPESAGPPAPAEPIPESASVAAPPGHADAQQPAQAHAPGQARQPASALLILAAALLILAGAIMVYTWSIRSSTSRLAESPPVPAEPSSPREAAPSFVLPSLRGPERVSLADFRGQVVVINFFASWCKPCELEAADLQRTWQKVQGRGVTFLGVAIQDQYRDAQAFLVKHGNTYPAVFDDSGDVMRAYRITGIPTTVFVDPQGRVAGRHAGIFVGDEGVARLLARIETARGAPR